MSINNIKQNVYSDEWHTDETIVNLGLYYLQPKQNTVVLCPYDTANSLYVKSLQKFGCKVIFAIDDFITNNSYKFDYLITNPPFSIKDKVIEQVYKYGKPSLLMLPLDSLGGVKRTSLYKQYGEPFVIIPRRRINYYDENGVKRMGASFHSIYALYNTGKSGIEWEQDDTI